MSQQGEDTAFKMLVWSVMEDRRLSAEEKLVVIGYTLYRGDPRPARIAQGASVDLEHLVGIERALADKGWLIEKGK